MIGKICKNIKYLFIKISQRNIKKKEILQSFAIIYKYYFAIWKILLTKKSFRKVQNGRYFNEILSWKKKKLSFKNV